MYINTKYSTYHWTSLYAPPGELITIDLPVNAVRKVGIVFNHQCFDGSGYSGRMDKLKCSYTLGYSKNTVGWPYGGHFDITTSIDQFPYGLELNISGGIRCPYFRYGQTTDEEWENEIRNYPGPLTIFDSGNLLAVLPSSNIRNSIQINDGMAFWRGVSRILYSVNEVTLYPRRNDGRIKNPMVMNFDNYVPAGAAVAYVGASFIQFPVSWYYALSSYETDRWGCWGNVHEYGHHFQSGWGYGAYTEVTNNALNLIHYSLLTEITASRQVTLGGAFDIKNSGWNVYTHQYNTIDSTALLMFYANNLYWMGSSLWRKVLKAHISQEYFTRNETYPYISELLLHCSYMFNRDMRKYFATFPNIFNYSDTSIVTEKTHTLLNSWNLKEFHPVALLYQTGYVVDNVEFETARPFNIPARAPYVFNFIKYMKTRSGMHTFSFQSIEGGQGTFTALATGIYKYTPPSNLSIIDKFYVNYKDDSNSEITKMVVSVKQVVNGTRCSFYNLSSSVTTVTQAYQILEANKDYSTVVLSTDGIVVPQYSSDTSYVPWVCLSEGVFIPNETGEYKFTFIHDEACLFYLSDSVLTGNIQTDASHLIANLTSYSIYYNINQNTKKINLTSGQNYYYRYVILNSAGAGNGKVGYVIGNSTTVITVPSSRVMQNYCNSSDYDHNVYIPNPENDPTLGHYYGTTAVLFDQTKFKLLQHPTQSSPNYNLTTLLFDYNTGTQPSLTYGTSFPLTYKVNFTESIKFDRLYLPTAYRHLIGTVNLTCDGTIISSKLFDTTTANRYIDLGRDYNCTVLQIDICSNEAGYWGPFTEIQPQWVISHSTNIIPVTHQYLYANGSATLTNKGLYFNGKGYQMTAGGNLTFKVMLNSTGDSIGILGDVSTNYGGIFDVYLDGVYNGTVNTSYVNPSYTNLAAEKVYQVSLYGLKGLTNATNHTVSIVAKSGTVGIAGFLADGDLAMISELEENADTGNANKNSYIRSAGFIIGCILLSITVIVLIVYFSAAFYQIHFKGGNPDRDVVTETIIV